MPTRAAVVYSTGYECDIGPHVFPMEKFRLTRDALVEAGDVGAGEVLEPEPAPREDLLLVHTAEYLDDLAHQRWTPRTLYSELPLTAEIVRAYELAAGGTTLAAREALARDVHQGNGTAGVFRDDGQVFTVSLHQELNYPVPKQRSSVDIGLPDGVGDAEYLRLLDDALERVWRFAPDVVLYQAGADPYREDLLGGLALSFEGLEARDRRVLEGCAARRIPAVVTLGGGYARDRRDTVRIHATTCRVAMRLCDAGAPERAT